nr:MAG TPA: hypothetical protein [Caudoviricetes sp.]
MKAYPSPDATATSCAPKTASRIICSPMTST